MARQHARDDAAQRAKNRGYSDAELDAALLRSQRSDLSGIVLRLAVLVVVYTLLAQAVQAGLSSPYLLLPLLVEMLAVFWIGWLLSRHVVDCPAFRKSAGSFWLTVAWTLAALFVLLAVLAYDRGQGQFALAHIAPAAAEAAHSVRAHGLQWPILALLGGLALSTWFDMQQWRRDGGVFFWASITTASFRIALGILLGTLGAIPLLIFGSTALGLAERFGAVDLLSRQLWAWPVWAALLLLDIGVVVLAAAMHRDLLRKAAVGTRDAGSGAGQRRRLP
jgi:hypothetical protein